MQATRSDRVVFDLAGSPYTLAVARFAGCPGVVGLMDLDEGDQVFVSAEAWPQVRALMDQYFRTMKGEKK